MKAEDTVITIPGAIENSLHELLERLLLYQAEETLEAGRKEVATEIGKHCYIWHDEANNQHICIDTKSWKAKLEEWRLK
ncbi:MAG: hypothetical protein KKD44_27560 [Proteobacteria bacterium]|nr:hypothetical protein [Pseudomonadota bacterium]